MIAYKKNCAVCKQIKLTPKLADEIYKTTAYDRTSKVSLATLQKLYGSKFSYPSLINHSKKHQGISAEDLSERHLNNIVKKAEKEITKKNIEAKDVWSTILDLGHEQIGDGTIKLKASDVTKAAKDKSDYELKVKDQELAMIEMVYHFASGENKAPILGKVVGKRTDGDPARTIIEAETIPDFDSAEESTGDFGVGEDRPSGVYYPPSWDASTSGPSALSTPDY